MNEPHDTDLLPPVLDSIERLESVINEHEKTIKSALHELRDLVIEHYERTTKRIDEHARRIRIIEKKLGLNMPQISDGL